MKNIFGLFLLLLLSLGQGSFAQTYKCGWYGKKTVEERNKIFPFNKAKKVMLIAYSNHEFMINTNGQRVIMDSLSLEEAKKDDPKIISKYDLKIEDFSRVYFSEEEILLDQKGIDELSNILVNHKLKKVPKGVFAVSFANCYTPRNSILFFDEKDEVFCYYEICFECGRSGMNPDPADLDKYSGIEECHGRLDIIKDFFRKNGIKYGVEERK